MKYEIKFTTQFKKDLKLANGESLDVKYRDHDLHGEYEGTRECHIEPDWLLIYEIRHNILVLMLNRVGSHSELF